MGKRKKSKEEFRSYPILQKHTSNHHTHSLQKFIKTKAGIFSGVFHSSCTASFIEAKSLAVFKLANVVSVDKNVRKLINGNYIPINIWINTLPHVKLL